MDWLPISSPVPVLATLAAICAFFFWLEKSTGWKFFQFLPSLVFIYLVPLVFSNTGLLVTKSPVYDTIQSIMLPMMLLLLLLSVDIRGAFRVMGRGLGVMLFGTLGVVLGAPIGLLVVRHWLEPNAWKAFGSLAGSWIGGTANLAAVSDMVGASGDEFGLAVLGDSMISYPVWLPILLASKRFSDTFARFTGVESDYVERMKQHALAHQTERRVPTARDYIYLLSIALLATWVSDVAAKNLVAFCSQNFPGIETYLSESTWRILLITSYGIVLSFTPLRGIAGSHELGMAFVYLNVARMGASAELGGIIHDGLPFLAGALIWIFIHGVFCLIGAKLFRTDIHTAAIASAANIGGPANATIVASYHEPALVPYGILMALVGYALGNYGGYAAALLCRMVS